jgi:phage terminase large subunit-like protein
MTPESGSLRSSLESLSQADRARILSELDEPTAEWLLYDWEGCWARPTQVLPAGAWRTALWLSGRGWGKTRTGAEGVRSVVEAGEAGYVALVAPTAADARDVMVEGESGILAISPPWFRPIYEPSKRRLTWPNGAQATTFSADEPDRLRGPQHSLAWADELAAWRYPEAWDMLQLGLRLGANPRNIVTTTPRPLPMLRKLIADPSTVVIRGTTMENRENLAPAFIDEILRQYEGTRLGRQEIYAEILDDTPGALWTRAQLEDLRVPSAPRLTRIVIGIDPAVSTKDGSAETGIVAVGVGSCHCKGHPEIHAFVLDDISGRLQPLAWASAAIGLLRKLKGSRIVGEANQGGNLVEANIRALDTAIPFTSVTAHDGKRSRAEPIAGLYSQGKVHHVGSLPTLEDQMATWAALTTGERSPDRIDALVWAITDLLPMLRGRIDEERTPFVIGAPRRM